MTATADLFKNRLAGAQRVHLILDYDGTLADFAPTPVQVAPDPELIDLVRRLARHPRLCVTVLSGRRLDQLQALLPVQGCLLAGTYGIELSTPRGERIEQVEMAAVRPALERLKARWQAEIAGRPGFFLEDKGWALALHARFAPENQAQEVLSAARRAAARLAALEQPEGVFRQHGGPRFYEVCPALAHKGRAVEWLLAQDYCPEALPVYLGDDYNDEEAFAIIQAQRGLAILVALEPRPTQADLRLAGPQAARRWLEDLLESLMGSDVGMDG